MSPAAVVSFEEARHIVEQNAAKVRSTETESVELLSANGRVLAEPILADRDFPPFPRATRDGYAVRAADIEQIPVRLTVIGEIKAGDSPQPQNLSIHPGQAVSIMTGAALPAGADAVVMVEYTIALSVADGDKSVEICRDVKSGQNFVPLAAEARAGQILVPSGERLDHAVIGIAASVGKSRVSVFRKPRIAVISTGDELVEIHSTPGTAKIRNSNSYSLAAQIEQAGGEPVLFPIARDEPLHLRKLMEQSLACDLLLLTGGVSMGKYDLVERVLEEMKAEFFFTGARIQPGKPIVFGSCNADNRVSKPRYFFGLPGNPVSTMVTFKLFAQPMIAALAGEHPRSLIFLRALLKSEVRTATGLTRFLPALLTGEFDRAEVELAAWQGSGDIAALARTNCYLVIPPDRERLPAGESVSILLR